MQTQFSWFGFNLTPTELTLTVPNKDDYAFSVLPISQEYEHLTIPMGSATKLVARRSV